MTKEAIILAGGLGTRLRNTVPDLPKPMAPVNGKPFLSYLLNFLIQEGIEKIVLSVGYKHEAILNYFGHTFRNLKLEYSIEDTPLGTGGAISLALEKCKSDHIFIFNGDTFFPIDLEKLAEKHIQTEAETTIALKKIEVTDRYGTVSLGLNSWIEKFEEKGKSTSPLINGGIYLLDKKKFAFRQLPEKFSFEKDYLEKTTSEHCIAGYVFDTYFLDIGIRESFNQAQKDFLKFT